MHKLHKLTLMGAALAAFASHSAADVLITATEELGGVAISGSGTLDLTGLSLAFEGSQLTFIEPAEGSVSAGGPSPNSGDIDSYALPGGTVIPSFGPGGFIQASSSTGDEFGLFGPFGEIFVPDGYVSGDPLTGSSFYDGATFASLGMTPGEYSVSLPSGDMLTLSIVIPGPASLGLLGLGGLALCRRRRD